MQETQVPSLGGEDPLEEGVVTHSSILVHPMDRGAWGATVHGVAESDTTTGLSTQAPVTSASCAVALKKGQTCSKNSIAGK